MEESKRDINSDDRNWIDQSIETGIKICEHYLKQDVSEISLTQLDEIFQTWKKDPSENRPSEQGIASGLGCLFGEYVVSKDNAKWIVVSDSYGTELSVKTVVGTNIYPINAVWKRIEPENQDLSFFEPIYSTLDLKL